MHHHGLPFVVTTTTAAAAAIVGSSSILPTLSNPAIEWQAIGNRPRIAIIVNQAGVYGVLSDAVCPRARENASSLAMHTSATRDEEERKVTRAPSVNFNGSFNNLISGVEKLRVNVSHCIKVFVSMEDEERFLVA